MTEQQKREARRSEIRWGLTIVVIGVLIIAAVFVPIPTVWKLLGQACVVCSGLMVMMFGAAMLEARGE